MQTANTILRIARQHGLDAMARDDGAAATIFIPFINVRTNESGIEHVECFSARDAYRAVGY